MGQPGPVESQSAFSWPPSRPSPRQKPLLSSGCSAWHPGGPPQPRCSPAFLQLPGRRPGLSLVQVLSCFMGHPSFHNGCQVANTPLGHLWVHILTASYGLHTSQCSSLPVSSKQSIENATLLYCTCCSKGQLVDKHCDQGWLQDV